MAGDLTGDGYADIMGIAGNGVHVIGHGNYLDFAYDADGTMVSASVAEVYASSVTETTTVYVGDHQQWDEGVATNFYHHNGRRVAMRTGNDVSYLHADHLQSTTDTTGDEDSGPQLYYPYGETRSSAEVATEYQYTGQRWQDELGLYYYNARWYDPQMRRFVQADTIVPEPGNPQSLNRYAYASNNPVKYNDPSGHYFESPVDVLFIAMDLGFLLVDVVDMGFHGVTPENQAALRLDTLALALDVGCLFVPGTGGGLGGRGAAGDATLVAQGTAKAQQMVKVGQSAYKMVKAGAQLMHFAEESQPLVPPDPDSVYVNDHARKGLEARGWTEEEILQTVKDPALTRNTRNHPNVWRRETGNTTTYYYRPDGYYVAVDDITAEVYHISNTNDPGWIDPMTNQVITPINGD